MKDQQPGGAEGPRILVAEEICVDLAAQQLWVNGEQTPLRQKAWRLLLALMSRPGELLSKETLINAGWGDQPVTDGVLTTAMKELRRALGDDPRQPRVIETAHGRGYRFLLPVSGVKPAEPAAAALEAPVQPPGTAAPVAGAMPRWQWPLLGLALLLAVLALWRPWADPAPGRPGQESRPGTAPVPEHSIALLPLDDFSPDGGRRWFADGLAEEILNVLAQVPGLQVASRTSSFRFRTPERDLRDIASDLGVAYVMEGSVRAAGDTLRVTLQLIRADKGLHVFSRSWDRPLNPGDVFTLQQDIAREVVAAIDSSLAVAGNHPLVATETSQAAYEAFLHGRELMEGRDPAHLAEAIRLLQGAVTESPDFAPARAALGEALILSGQHSLEGLATVLVDASHYIEQALGEAPSDPQVLRSAALLRLVQGHREQSLALVDQALDASPGLAELHFRRATVLAMLQRYPESRRAYFRAYLLDPLSPATVAAVALVHFMEGEADKALVLGKKNQRWNPAHPIASEMLGRILLGTGDYEGAADAFIASLPHDSGNFFARYHLDSLRWRLGMDAELLAGDPVDAGVPARAAAYLARNDPAAAREVLAGVPDTMMHGLNALDIAYWAGDWDAAQDTADHYVTALALLDSDAWMFYPDVLYQAALIREAAGRADAAPLLERLDRLYGDWRVPEGALSDRDALAAAAYYQLQDRPDDALALLERARSQGLVLRELAFDPVFDSLRGEARFQSLWAGMQARAEGLRADLPDHQSRQ